MTPRTPNRLALLLLALVVLAAVLGRVLGPSGLDSKDQPRTVAYTVDMLINGRWLWPIDMEGAPAFKPPLYNWLSVPAIALTGQWDDWAFALPSLVSALLLAAVTAALARWLLPGRPAQAAALAAAMWLANVGTIRLLYVARPDMLLALFLVTAWAAAEWLLRPGRRRRWPAALLLWCSVGLAALTKGPPAVLPVIYIVLASRLLHGRFAAVRWTGLVWGLPLAVGLFALWALPALQTPQSARALEALRGYESDRLGGLWPILATSWEAPYDFVVRFLPWSPLFIAALVVINPRRWLRHPTGPAILWALLVVGFFSFASAQKRDDYLLPAYPAAAIVAAWLVARLWARRAAWLVPAALSGAVVFCVGSTLNDFFWKEQTRQRLAEHTRAFARRVRPIIGDDPVVFVDTGYNNLQARLGRNQAGEASPDAWAGAAWLIRPVDGAEAPPVAVSEPIPRVLKRRRAASVGLYQLEPRPSGQ